MKTKLLALLAQLKGLTSSLQLKGLLVGLALGYLGHPIIKLAVDAVLLLVKGLFKI